MLFLLHRDERRAGVFPILTGAPPFEFPVGSGPFSFSSFPICPRGSSPQYPLFLSVNTNPEGAGFFFFFPFPATKRKPRPPKELRGHVFPPQRGRPHLPPPFHREEVHRYLFPLRGRGGVFPLLYHVQRGPVVSLPSPPLVLSPLSFPPWAVKGRMACFFPIPLSGPEILF